MNTRNSIKCAPINRLPSQVTGPRKTNKKVTLDAERLERKRRAQKKFFHRMLQNETSEQRAIRLQKDNDGQRRRKAAQRLNQTPEEKMKFLFQRREYYRKKRELMNKRTYVKRFVGN